MTALFGVILGMALGDHRSRDVAASAQTAAGGAPAADLDADPLGDGEALSKSACRMKRGTDSGTLSSDQCRLLTSTTLNKLRSSCPPIVKSVDCGHDFGEAVSQRNYV